MQYVFEHFKDGFLDAMTEDYYLTMREMDLPEVDFAAPSIHNVLQELWEESQQVIDKAKHKKGYLTPSDYAKLGSDLYIALMYDSSYTPYEDSGILDKYRLHLNFDFETGEYHDFSLCRVGRR